MKKCAFCGAANPATARFCENCGQALSEPAAQPSKTCPRCQQQNPIASAFCENCGFDFAAKQQSSQADVASSMGPIVCANCGASNPAASAFCEACGTKLIGASAAPTSSAKQPHSEATSAESEQSASAGPTKSSGQGAVQPQKSSKMIKAATPPVNEKPAKVTTAQRVQKPKTKAKLSVVVGGIVVILLAVGAYLLFFTQPNNSATVQTADHSSVTESDKVAESLSRENESLEKSQTESSRAIAHQVNFERAKIKADMNSTIGAISGDNSVYIAPVTGTQSVVLNTIGAISGDNSVYIAPVTGTQSVVLNNQPQRAASSIKLFIMITAYAQVDSGKLNVNDHYRLDEADIVGGTGVVQNMTPGTQLSYQELIAHMIEDSDNTAANILIDKLGGLNTINSTCASLGATDTQMQRKMMDTAALEAGKDNMTTAKDMGVMMKMIYNHKLISKQVDNTMLDILAKTKNRTKLPQALDSSVTVYNKTGEYADYGVQNDTAIIKNDQGAFVVSVLSQNGAEDEQKKAMNDLGSLLYQDILE